jgi:ABC-type transporter Mla maintaining outer membrane lipid asymmetry permease subunit MlaE
VLLADLVYNVPANVIVDSARRALTSYDVLTSMLKSWVFGSIVAVVSAALHARVLLRWCMPER